MYGGSVVGRQQIAMHPAAVDAARILGQQIRLARHERNWTATELADRAGVSARTVTAIEKGSAAVSIGNALNVAAAVGIPLFSVDGTDGLAAERRIGDDKPALIPDHVYHRSGGGRVDLDF